MVIVRDMAIMISKGETFATLFSLDKSGYELDGTEVIKFNVKQFPDDATVLLSLEGTINVENNTIFVYGSREQMSILQAGDYFYDLSMTASSGALFTLTYPSPFIVREVCYE